MKVLRRRVFAVQQRAVAGREAFGNFVGRRFRLGFGHDRRRVMYQPAGVRISPDLPIPDQMKAWVLDDPDYLSLREKPVPIPARAEVLVRIDAVAICATDLEIIHSGSPASIQG